MRNGKSCQHVKKPPAVAPLTPWLWPSNPWHYIDTDYAEDEKGNYFILVDAHSRWPEIYFMQKKRESDTNRGRCYLTGTFFQIQISGALRQ